MEVGLFSGDYGTCEENYYGTVFSGWVEVMAAKQQITRACIIK